MDYEYMALTLTNLSSIPVRLYRDGKFAGLFHSSKFKPDLAILEEPNIFQNSASVSYYMTDEFLFYGLFRMKQEPICMVLGPVAQVPIDRSAAGRILLAAGESPTRVPELMHYLHSIPQYPLRNFLQILCSFAFFLNNEKLSPADILISDFRLPELDTAVPTPVSSDAYSHNTYDLEQTLLSCIEFGKPEELEAMFRLPASGRAGTMAHDALRQQKNLVIVSATLCSRAAIRGGMDAEAALTLSDLYIQKAELLNRYEDLVKLLAQMSLEYAQRVEDLRCGEGNRKLIRSARKYILAHINEKITTQALAKALGRNRTYLCECFKKETGQSLSDYVTGLKMEEAKRLLRFSSKSLFAIGDHLGYSSQSHFQNVFKKTVGITPLQYRQAEKVSVG